MNDEWGYRLASIIDGEGSFNIPFNRPSAYACRFTLAMRADDEPFIRRLREEAGCIGSLHVSSTQGNGLSVWSVDSRADCVELALILERYPLYSKKASDYVIWRAALGAWANHDWVHMALLREQLHQGRKFRAPQAPPITSPQQSLLTRGAA